MVPNDPALLASTAEWHLFQQSRGKASKPRVVDQAFNDITNACVANLSSTAKPDRRARPPIQRDRVESAYWAMTFGAVIYKVSPADFAGKMYRRWLGPVQIQVIALRANDQQGGIHTPTMVHEPPAGLVLEPVTGAMHAPAQLPQLGGQNARDDSAKAVFSQKSSLQNDGLQTFWQGQAELVQQDGLVLGRLGDASFADRLAAAGGQDHVDGLDGRDLVQHFSGLVAKAGGLAHLAEGFPEHIRQEADQHIGLHALLFLIAKSGAVSGRFCGCGTPTRPR